MFSNNKANYGPNIAGIPSTLELISDNSTTAVTGKRMLSASPGQVAVSVGDGSSEIRSIPKIRLAVKDIYGQIVTTENQLPIKVSLVGDGSASLMTGVE
jgi:hypothetical protein